MLRDPGPGAQASSGAADSANLDTADSTELQTLPRVGPVLAERMDAVPGKGEAMMAALLPLLPLVTV